MIAARTSAQSQSVIAKVVSVVFFDPRLGGMGAEYH